jgi:hypothetical protein
MVCPHIRNLSIDVSLAGARRLAEPGIAFVLLLAAGAFLWALIA